MWTRVDPVQSGLNWAIATLHSTKTIWNWNVKNLVKYAEYICAETFAFLSLDVFSLVCPKGSYSLMGLLLDSDTTENGRRLLPLHKSIHRQLFLCFCLQQIKKLQLSAIQLEFLRLRYVLNFCQNVWQAPHLVARQPWTQWGWRTGHCCCHSPAFSSRTRNLWLENKEWRGVFDV